MSTEQSVPGVESGELDRLVIFDTTLRDGEQTPGATMTLPQKLAVAEQLQALGVDVIEAGFPAASPGDHEAVHAVAEAIDNATVAGLSRIWPPTDIEACATAVAPAKRRRIHTFVGTSPLHLQALRWAKDADHVVARAAEAVRQARGHCDDVEFSAMDASRTDRAYLAEIVSAAVEAGATTINIPDTVGYATPEEWGALIRWLHEAVPSLADVIVSVHCHDDLGMATANSLAAVRAGARQVEGCINGIGERAGNAALEEVVMAVRLHPQIYGVRTNVVAGEIAATSKLVSQVTGVIVQPNKAVVGANAFAHASGIHQDGVLKNRRTFEIMDAEEIGVDSKLILGKLSGRHALRVRLYELGFEINDDEIVDLFARFKAVADRKREVDDNDLRQIVRDARTEREEAAS